jgi:hypothetical protein
LKKAKLVLTPMKKNLQKLSSKGFKNNQRALTSKPRLLYKRNWHFLTNTLE